MKMSPLQARNSRLTRILPQESLVFACTSWPSRCIDVPLSDGLVVWNLSMIPRWIRVWHGALAKRIRSLGTEQRLINKQVIFTCFETVAECLSNLGLVARPNFRCARICTFVLEVVWMAYSFSALLKCQRPQNWKTLCEPGFAFTTFDSGVQNDLQDTNYHRDKILSNTYRHLAESQHCNSALWEAIRITRKMFTKFQHVSHVPFQSFQFISSVSPLHLSYGCALFDEALDNVPTSSEVRAFQFMYQMCIV